jgi:methylmalonyl-CoA mutase
MISVSPPDSAFSAPGWHDWLSAAQKEFAGTDAINKLKFLNGSLEINAFYSESPAGADNFALPPALDTYHGARAWASLPKVRIKDTRQANKQALNHLNAGADGILFEISPGNFYPDEMLHGIFWEQCPVSYLLNSPATATLEKLLQTAEKKFRAGELTGCIFWKEPPVGVSELVKRFQSWKKFYPLGHVIRPQTDAVEEVAVALHNAVKTIDHFSAEGIPPETTIDQTAFSLTAGSDFFITIAKLKALRNLWWQVRGAYGSKREHPLHIHVTSTPDSKTEYQPHANMIKGSLAGIAAVVGGCDSLTTEAEDESNPTMARIARNVSSILREEAHLSKVADPTSGSYFLDSLGRQLAEKAWHQFQTKQSG